LGERGLLRWACEAWGTSNISWWRSIPSRWRQVDEKTDYGILETRQLLIEFVGGEPGTDARSVPVVASFIHDVDILLHSRLIGGVRLLPCDPVQRSNVGALHDPNFRDGGTVKAVFTGGPPASPVKKRRES